MGREEMCCSDGCGKMTVLAALLLALGIIGGGYFVSQGDYSSKVNITSGATNPNVYVSSTPPEHMVSVSGTASTKVSPDLLNIQVRVQTDSGHAKKSQQDNAAVSADLQSKIKALGIDEKDIQTVSYSVDPIYDSVYKCDINNNCHYDSLIRGYRTTHTLNVRVMDLTKGGDVIDTASTAGDNQTFVDYVQFTLKEETRRSLEKALLQNASVEAKGRAQSIFYGLGVSLGRTLTASESFYYPQPIYRDFYAKEAMAGSAPSTQLSPGQVDVSATVNVGFEVK